MSQFYVNYIGVPDPRKFEKHANPRVAENSTQFKSRTGPAEKDKDGKIAGHNKKMKFQDRKPNIKVGQEIRPLSHHVADGSEAHDYKGKEGAEV